MAKARKIKNASKGFEVRTVRGAAVRVRRKNIAVAGMTPRERKRAQKAALKAGYAGRGTATNSWTGGGG